ncbi:MAG: hypothetical protein JWR83_1877 [Aeromicrobium sp.]|nr:hypothetical protein [Aeromicrobium sp.]
MGRRQAVAAVALGLLQLVVLVTLALAGPADEPHRAEIRVVAPPVVATALVNRANALAGSPVHAEALATAAEARRSVQHGHSVAAVVVDLAVETDTLYVASANGTDLNRAVRHQIDAVERSFGRGLVVRDLVPARSGDAGARGVYAITGACVLIGFIIAIVIAWRRGPVAPTLATGLARLAVVAAISVAVGMTAGVIAALRYNGGFVRWSLIAALTVLAVTTTTMALESLIGVYGIGVATTLFVISGAPLVRLISPLMLPAPWATVTPWLPHGASLAAGSGQAYFGGPDVRPLLVLAVWVVVSVMTMGIARRERPASAF